MWDVPGATAAFTYIDGDGTVPTESATAHGLEAAATASIQGVSHRDLVGVQGVWDQVLTWLQAPEQLGERAGQPGQPGQPGQQPLLSPTGGGLGSCLGTSGWSGEMPVQQLSAQAAAGEQPAGWAAASAPAELRLELHAQQLGQGQQRGQGCPREGGKLVGSEVEEGENFINPLVWWALMT